MTKEEAMEIVKKLYNDSLFLKKDKEAMLTLIPELKESEDERIRKVLCGIVRDMPYMETELRAHGLTVEKTLAYLEKQKEQKMLSGFDELTPDEEMSHPLYLKGFDAGRNLQKVLQKPAEWSEENECHLDAIIEDYQILLKYYKDSRGRNYFPNASVGVLRSEEKDIAFLKSLRPQQKQEVVDRTVFDRIADILRWCVLPIGCPVENFKESESEREHLLHVVQCVAHRYANSCMYCKEYGRGYQEGLNAHWKPSEVRMDDLSTAEAILREFGYDMVADGIAELREDLEKL